MTEFHASRSLAVPGIRPLPAALSFFALGVALALIPLVPNALLYALVAGIVVCWLLPLWIDWNRRVLDWFEPIHASGFVWVVYFGIGAVATVQYPSKVAYNRYVVPFIPLATFYCLLGYVMLLIGYYACWPKQRRTREIEEYPTSALFIAIPAALGFIGFMAQHLWYRAMKLGLSIGGLVSSLGQLAPLFVFAWSLAWLLFFVGNARRSWKLLLFGGMVPAAGIVIVNNMNNKSMIAALLGIPLMALWYARRRIPWLTLLILVLVVVFVIFPFNNTYRNLDESIPTGKRLELTSRVINQWSLEQYIDRSVMSFLARNALVNSVAIVIKEVPRWIPYAQGRTIFLPTLVFFVPRVFWPDKPADEFGREFGETFRVLHILDQETSIAVTVPGELYWNFSVPGVVFGMFLWGLVLRWYYRTYAEAAALDPIRRAIHMLLLIQFLHFEAGLASPSVTVIRTLMVLEAYRFVARRFGLAIRVRKPHPGG